MINFSGMDIHVQGKIGVTCYWYRGVLTQSHMGQAVKDLTTDWKVYFLELNRPIVGVPNFDPEPYVHLSYKVVPC